MIDVCDKFQSLEVNEGFTNLVIDDIRCWHLIRSYLYTEIINELFHPDELHPDELIKNSLYEKCKIGARFIYNSISNNPFLKYKKNRTFLVLAAPRKVLTKDGFIYPIIDPILEKLSEDYNYIERPNHFCHIKYSIPRNITYSDVIELKRLVNSFFCTSKMCDSVEKQLSPYITKINREFSIILQNKKIFDRVAYMLIGYNTYYKAYKKLIRKYKPKRILEVVHYDISSFAMTKAAHDYGLDVTELQHGTMGNLHIAYNLSFIDEYLPNDILLFGDFWKDYTNYPIKDSMLSVGYLYIDQYISRFKKEEYKRKKILFLSQGPVAKDLIMVALKLDKLIKENKKNYEIIFKLHPNEYKSWKHNYKDLYESDIIVIDNNDKQLYDYFIESVCQVGVSSTAIIEGMAFQLKTFILEAYSFEYFDVFIKNGMFKLIHNAEDIINGLVDCDFSAYESNYVWNHQSEININSYIESVK